MASNRDTSNGPDWKDVAAAAYHFEEVWEARVEIVGKVSGATKQPTLYWTAVLIETDGKTGEVKRSDLASVSMLTRGGGDTNSALLLLLYELDKELYRRVEGFPPKTA